MALVEGIDKRLIGTEFDSVTFDVTEHEIVEYAASCGETDPRFTDPTHPDFQAPPTLTAKYVGRRMLPRDFPRLGRNTFDAGKAVTAHGPIRPGDRITAHAEIADVYEKTGRSGPMLFIVHRMKFSNQRGERVAVVDWRLVRRSDPE